MRKLKVESLQVESFPTTPNAPSTRGTVQAHGSIHHSPSLETYDPAACGETQYFDCSLGCPSIAPCGVTDIDCA